MSDLRWTSWKERKYGEAEDDHEPEPEQKADETDLPELMKCMKTFRKHILQEGAGPEAFEFLRKMENHCLTKMLDR